LRGADAGEGGREKQQHGLLLAEIVTQFDVLQSVGGFGFQSEVGGFRAYSDGHGRELGGVGWSFRATVARKGTGTLSRCPHRRKPFFHCRSSNSAISFFPTESIRNALARVRPRPVYSRTSVHDHPQ